jgi:hypothetical protein
VERVREGAARGRSRGKFIVQRLIKGGRTVATKKPRKILVTRKPTTLTPWQHDPQRGKSH